jgi:YHS domain-containing protein
MNVVRLVVLALLAYLGWSLLRGLLGRGNTGTSGRRQDNAARDSKVKDVLVEDPVCHKLVPKHQAIRLREKGTTYYFCSDECCDKFSEKSRGAK